MSFALVNDDEYAKKKRRLNDAQHEERAHFEETPSSVSIKLSRNDYTVAWICALSLELTAAKAMLDVEHEMLPVPANDRNIYSLGSVCGHNLVITCLPSGSYGITSAALVASYLTSTFPSIAIPLMVGIGGGVPRPGYDIRLGDVVISTPTSEYPAVIQYDFDKTGANGISELKGTLNKPSSYLLKAVADLKATHQLKTSRAPLYMKKALDQYSLTDHGFAYPGLNTDILFPAVWNHGQECPNVDPCALREQITRPSRPNADPIIHYGTIASENHVIKHGPTRDRLAEKYNVLCFEMEAAGLMDEYRCLIIWAICDYCDNYKHKHIQNYSALAAAAVAKELLSIIPIRESLTQIDTTQVIAEALEHRQSTLEALDFEESDSRRATVKKVHAQTCQWIFEQAEYVTWSYAGGSHEDYYLLWIRGKPGTGKSTIMKYMLERTEKQRCPNMIIISFFFHTRGHDLEKSTVGMYRSLVHQLLTKVPELQVLLDKLNPVTASVQASLEVLEGILRRAIKLLGSKHLICFVDALDECPEEQIRKMVRFLEEICDIKASKDAYLQVLFSSRHDPNISINRGSGITLEDQ